MSLPSRARRSIGPPRKWRNANSLENDWQSVQDEEEEEEDEEEEKWDKGKEEEEEEENKNMKKKKKEEETKKNEKHKKEEKKKTMKYSLLVTNLEWRHQHMLSNFFTYIRAF